MQLVQLLRDQLARLLRFLGTKAVKVAQPGVDNRLGHRLAAVTAHRLARTVDLHAIVCARRNRETAVETFLLVNSIGQNCCATQMGCGRIIAAEGTENTEIYNLH